MPPWFDPRSRKSIPLRVRPDMPLPARLRQRLLSRLWPHVLAKFQLEGKWNANLKLGVTGARGEFSITDNNKDDHW
eukprot:8367119-Pyramimonas_sp.AAC.1